jgi:hypothetical protein
MTANEPPALPAPEPLGAAAQPAKLEPLVETARAYGRAATSKNTNRAYAADWREVEIGRGSTDATCPVAALQA